MPTDIATKLVQTLTAEGLTCATAESCTGGGVGSAITAVPGSSAVFRGGIISYASEVKHDILGVANETLNTVGAVSAECAEQMAEGARKHLKADIAVSVTGVAGPDSSEGHPAGFVWFGRADSHGSYSENKLFPGSREEVRAAAITHALTLLMPR